MAAPHCMCWHLRDRPRPWGNGRTQDGVLVDSAAETALSGYAAAKALWSVQNAPITWTSGARRAVYRAVSTGVCLLRRVFRPACCAASGR